MLYVDLCNFEDNCKHTVKYYISINLAVLLFYHILVTNHCNINRNCNKYSVYGCIAGKVTDQKAIISPKSPIKIVLY